MNRRPKRENIKKPLRYETTESSDNEGESAKRYKEQNKTSVTDEIRDIRKNLSQYENEELAKQKAINSASKCYSASQNDKSLHLPSRIDDSCVHGSQPIIASQLALNSQPFANTTPISHNQFPATSVTNSPIVSQSSFCTISKPSCSSTINHPTFANSQTLSESQTSFPLTSMNDTEQIRNKKYDYEMNNNTHTECPIENIEIPCQNATKHLSSYEYLPVSSASHIPPTISMTNNMVYYTPHHNRESTHNQKMGHLENTIESSSVISPESYTSPSPQSCSSSLSRDSETPSLTLLSAPVLHNNVTYNTQPNTLTSNHEHPNPTITYHQNTPQENTNIINEIKMQVMECVRNVMTEFRTKNQCLHREKINRRPVKPKIIPFHTVEAVLEFNQSDDTIYTEMVEYLTSIGGRNPKEIIHLAFKEIFITNVALSFTWTGKDNNNRSTMEKLSNQRIIDALYDATSVHSKLTTAEFKYYVSEALRSAKQRYRHQQRMDRRN
ncbi:uncharacterized protein LOC112637027 isoform X1 [Camponotus floridanus]|uniref:uncharacterized protein LOC105251751 isoform X1 n=1 Tax=Camponotus floridanus TaxID=104421 RepID=UPI00059C3632|nr:uncharacterized protein LOC105251751 isoform X1 [Camponotus floridanus]XP_025266730.1 uncharacterized protein LOC112637027 isoform X1 [Camponotus floridanus]